MLHVPGRFCRGCTQLLTDAPYLGKLAGEQSRDLCLEGSRVDDLAERGVCRQWQQIAGYVEGSRLQGAFVGFGLHRLGLRNS